MVAHAGHGASGWAHLKKSVALKRTNPQRNGQKAAMQTQIGALNSAHFVAVVAVVAVVTLCSSNT